MNGFATSFSRLCCSVADIDDPLFEGKATPSGHCGPLHMCSLLPNAVASAGHQCKNELQICMCPTLCVKCQAGDIEPMSLELGCWHVWCRLMPDEHHRMFASSPCCNCLAI